MTSVCARRSAGNVPSSTCGHRAIRRRHSWAMSLGTFTVGDFALFVSYLWFTTQVPSEIGTFFGDYKTQEASIERMVELIRPESPGTLVEFHPVYVMGPLPDLPFTPKAARHRLDALDVAGLTFHYPGSDRGPATG